ncbi:MAG: fumarylacetoacetate hydrolase family protein [Rhodospirillaceae bacterium]
MDPTILPQVPQTTISVAGSTARFPVRRIYCVGRNYADHALEMGGDPKSEPPFYFSKPADALIEGGGDVPYPPQTSKLHHEVELVVALGSGGADIPVAEALDCVWGYGVGIDLTRRDMQAAAKDQGRPWDLSKGFDNSAVIGPIHPVSAVGHPTEGTVSLSVNGQTKQSGTLSQMIWGIPDVISVLSQSVALAPGDLIYTGTPSGVGALERGDVCEVALAGLGGYVVKIV